MHRLKIELNQGELAGFVAAHDAGRIGRAIRGHAVKVDRVEHHRQNGDDFSVNRDQHAATEAFRGSDRGPVEFDHARQRALNARTQRIQTRVGRAAGVRDDPN